MLDLKFIFSLIAISIAYSADIVPGYTIIEVFDSRDYQVRENYDKVNVSLYYESLCPGCIAFHTYIFNRAVSKLAPYINVATYPYGNAVTTQENGKTLIKCQHGPSECYGNKLHACAIDILKNNTLSVFYNSCMMKGSSTDHDATTCGESMGIDAKPIMECAKGKKGDDLLEYYGKETKKHCPDMAYVPWPLLNGRVYIGEHRAFQSTICSYLANPPPVCNE